MIIKIKKVLNKHHQIKKQTKTNTVQQTSFASVWVLLKSICPSSKGSSLTGGPIFPKYLKKQLKKKKN
jgi:hypothetical protein